MYAEGRNPDFLKSLLRPGLQNPLRKIHVHPTHLVAVVWKAVRRQLFWGFFFFCVLEYVLCTRVWFCLKWSDRWFGWRLWSSKSPPSILSPPPTPPPTHLFLQCCSMGPLLPSCFSEEEGRNSERDLLWVIRAHSVMRVALRPTVLFVKLHVNVFVTSCLHRALCKIELCKNYLEEAPTSGVVYIPCIYSYARWELSQAIQVLVVIMFAWHHSSTN